MWVLNHSFGCRARPGAQGSARLPGRAALLLAGTLAAASCQPPLTTVGPDWTKIAEVTLDVIDRGLHSRQSQRINQVVPFKMALRESTAPPAKR